MNWKQVVLSFSLFRTDPLQSWYNKVCTHIVWPFRDPSHWGLLGLWANASCYAINYFFVFQLWCLKRLQFIDEINLNLTYKIKIWSRYWWGFEPAQSIMSSLWLRSQLSEQCEIRCHASVVLDSYNPLCMYRMNAGRIVQNESVRSSVS